LTQTVEPVSIAYDPDERRRNPKAAQLAAFTTVAAAEALARPRRVALLGVEHTPSGALVDRQLVQADSDTEPLDFFAFDQAALTEQQAADLVRLVLGPDVEIHAIDLTTGRTVIL
jgi:hypothetical protein